MLIFEGGVWVKICVSVSVVCCQFDWVNKLVQIYLDVLDFMNWEVGFYVNECLKNYEWIWVLFEIVWIFIKYVMLESFKVSYQVVFD